MIIWFKQVLEIIILDVHFYLNEKEKQTLTHTTG